MRPQLVGMCLAVAVGAGTVWAEVDSGPAVGQAVAALSVRTVQSGKAEDAKDVAAERAEQPTVYVFLPAARFDRPTARFLKGVDAAVQKLQTKAPQLAVIVVWLTEDVEGAAQRLTQIQGSLQLQASTWTVFPGPVAGPEGWAINDRAAATTIVVRKGRVTARTADASVNETLVPEVERAVRAVVEE